MRIFPSAVTSAWCEIDTLFGSFGPLSFALLGRIAIVRTLPSSTRPTSTTNVELIAATYAVLPSREKWTSCGRQSPLALEPSGCLTTTHVNAAPAGQRVASAALLSSISRQRCTAWPALALRRSTTSIAQSEQQFEIASQSPPLCSVALCAPPGGFATHVRRFVSNRAVSSLKSSR